ncbi:hypothetical protein LZD49_03130 [Dyadobacter sp. CY261]|uniref:hypothetical protein n=1 Tax=Dyadobacter sp. CY261 TaxID=2907203 RepID=UPI001F1BAD30|nr:hypothetical protein [Dyadobacter sp. CY261]MCF0069447.1 hypothetical protein [Dyadobacter sp. CY261]
MNRRSLDLISQTRSSSSSSPLAKMFFICLLIAGTSTPNSSTKRFWLSQNVLLIENYLYFDIPRENCKK